MADKNESNVVDIYAKALVLETEKANIRPQMEQEVDLLLSTLLTHKKFSVFIEGPHIPQKDKHDLIDKVMQGRFQQLLINLFHIIIDKKHPRLLSAILTHYQDQVDALRSIMPATLISAIELSSEQKAVIKKELEKLLNVNLHLRYRVNPEIIGGLIFRCEDLMIDQSLHGHLYKIKDQLEYKINLKHI